MPEQTAGEIRAIVDWLNWKAIPYLEIDTGPAMDRLTALWVWGWKVEQTGHDRVILVDADGHAGTPQPFSTDSTWAWRTLCRAAAMSEKGRAFIAIDVAEAASTQGERQGGPPQTEQWPVSVWIGDDVSRGPMPLACCRAAIGVAQALDNQGLLKNISERFLRWLKRGG